MVGRVLKHCATAVHLARMSPFWDVGPLLGIQIAFDTIMKSIIFASLY